MVVRCRIHEVARCCGIAQTVARLCNLARMVTRYRSQKATRCCGLMWTVARLCNLVRMVARYLRRKVARCCVLYNVNQYTYLGESEPNRFTLYTYGWYFF